MNVIVTGIREILYELIKSGRPWRRRIFRVGFRSQVIRAMVRKTFFKLERNPKNSLERKLIEEGAVNIGVINLEAVLTDLVKDEFTEDGSGVKFQNISEVLSDPNRTTGIYRSLGPHKKFNSVRDLAQNSQIIDLARFYLGHDARLVDSAHWITTPSNTLEDTSHEFGVHMDMGNWKWLNFFIYVNDVSKDNGAHCFIPGTHEKRHPLSFFERRMSRERICSVYGREALVYVEGGSGTTLAEDTSNYHGGSPVIKGHRHLLQLNFSNASNFSLVD